MALITFMATSTAALAEPAASVTETTEPNPTVTAADKNDLPKYEVGLGLGGVDYPHYPSSDQRKTTLIPFPYLIYRGSSIKVGRGGIVGQLFDSKRVNIDISLNGSLAVESDDNDAREGMDDLDFSFEFGPSLEILLYESSNENTSLELRFPFRALLVTDFSYISHEGWLTEPDIKFSHKFADHGPLSGWKASTAVRVLFADKGYYDYFFGVEPEFATPNRPAYEPGGGYGGVTLSTSVSKRWGSSGRIATSFYAAVQHLDGVEYEEGPLFRQDHAVTLGFVMFVRLWESEERAPEHDE